MLGHDFNSWGMEACRGSIPPPWRCACHPFPKAIYEAQHRVCSTSVWVSQSGQRIPTLLRCLQMCSFSPLVASTRNWGSSLLEHALDRSYRIGTLGTGMLSMKGHILLRLRYFSGLASFRCLHISEIMGGGDFRFAHVVYLSLQKQVDCRTSWSFRVAC